MTAVRAQRLHQLALELAKEIHDRGDAILIVREVADACAASPIVSESQVSLLAAAAGIAAAEARTPRGRVAVIAGEAYDQRKDLPLPALAKAAS